MEQGSHADGEQGTGRFEALLASVADPIYMVDSAGLIQFANPAAVSLLGFDSDSELLGRPSHQTIHHHRPDGTPFPEDECPLLEPLRNGGTVRVEEDWFVRADGSMVPVSYSSAAFRLESGWGAVVAFRDITERRDLEASERLRAAEEARSAELDASRRRVIAATDEARRRIVRDLHDGAQQQLLNAAMLIRTGVAELEKRDDIEVPEAFALAAERIKVSMTELRELAAGLHPVVLQSRGLAAGLDTLASRCSVPVRLRVPERRFDPEIEAAAYFLVAEALNNVEKHAGASLAEVELELVEDGSALVVSVRDDGSGEIAPADGIGLPGMADRVDALGGEIKISGEAGQGSSIRARLPL